MPLSSHFCRHVKTTMGRHEANNVIVNIDPQTCEFEIYAEKKVVDHVEDELAEISLTNAKMKDSKIRAWRCGTR